MSSWEILVTAAGVNRRAVGLRLAEANSTVSETTGARRTRPELFADGGSGDNIGAGTTTAGGSVVRRCVSNGIRSARRRAAMPPERRA
jgi:hypothetical protein